MTPGVLELPGGIDATADRLVLDPTSVEFAPAETVREVPFSMPSEQAYYWCFEWQRDERETLLGLDEGEYQDFDSDDPEDAARWLRGPDEDE